jgi:hypothetical protein
LGAFLARRAKNRAFRCNLFFLSQEKKDFRFNPLRAQGIKSLSANTSWMDIISFSSPPGPDCLCFSPRYESKLRIAVRASRAYCIFPHYVVCYVSLSLKKDSGNIDENEKQYESFIRKGKHCEAEFAFCT